MNPLLTLTIVTASFTTPALAFTPPSNTVFFDGPLSVIAHRGGVLETAEHTLLGFDYAASLDPDVILEMDVRLTSDGVPVLMHDITVDRTTNGTGNVADLTFAEIRSLSAGWDTTFDGGATFPFRGDNLLVPTLEEVVQAHPDRRMMIEIKVEAGVEAVQPVVDLLRANDMQDRVALASFDEAQVAAVRDIAPEFATLYSVGSAQNLVNGIAGGTFTPDLLVDDLLNVSQSFIGNNPGQVPLPLFDVIDDLGVPITVDTINDVATMEFYFNNPAIDGLVTDRPAVLLSVIPEPATAGFVAVAGGTLLLRRRG
jgi:glycerophosphoryl diester phosphodiesterase